MASRGEGTIVVRDVPGARVGRPALAAGVEAVYRDVFTAPPYDEPEGAARAFVARLQEQVDREGFRLSVAEAGVEVLGFAYGYTSRPGQWWHDRVVPKLEVGVAERWVRRGFCLVEFAVRRRAQGRGVGAALHDRVLEGLVQRAALTMTHQHENPTVDFYVRRGWRVLVEGFRFHERDAARLILGREVGEANN